MEIQECLGCCCWEREDVHNVVFQWTTAVAISPFVNHPSHTALWHRLVFNNVIQRNQRFNYGEMGPYKFQ